MKHLIIVEEDKQLVQGYIDCEFQNIVDWADSKKPVTLNFLDGKNIKGIVKGGGHTLDIEHCEDINTSLVETKPLELLPISNLFAQPRASEFVANTSDKYTKVVCVVNTEITGTWPKLTCRFHYQLKVRLTAYGSWYFNGGDGWFHNKHHSINLNLSFGSGGGTSGALASGYADIPYGGSDYHCVHTPGFGINCPNLWGGGSNARIDCQIPNITMYDCAAGATNVTATSADVKWRIHPNNNKYYYAKLYDYVSEKEFELDNNTGNGSNYVVQRVINLKPTTNYRFGVKVYDRLGKCRWTTPNNHNVAVFTTLEQLMAPTVFVAQETITAHSAKITWTALENAVAYNVYVDEKEPIRVDGYEYTITNLSPNTYVTVRVAGIDEHNSIGAKSEQLTFKTLSDQVSLRINVGGAVKKGKVFVNVNGNKKKVKNIYVNVNGVTKKLKRM